MGSQEKGLGSRWGDKGSEQGSEIQKGSRMNRGLRRYITEQR